MWACYERNKTNSYYTQIVLKTCPESAMSAISVTTLIPHSYRAHTSFVPRSYHMPRSERDLSMVGTRYERVLSHSYLAHTETCYFGMVWVHYESMSAVWARHKYGMSVVWTRFLPCAVLPLCQFRIHHSKVLTYCTVVNCLVKIEKRAKSKIN